ncbi:MAG: hypothetical protein FJW88_03130 [Actinobacteria bacterium]|nr:hypothetical protein [Actinomycetota bacterium]
MRRRRVGRNPAGIARALAPRGSDRDRWLTDATADDLRRELGAAVVSNFGADPIVDVAGWQLSLTEARTAALFFLDR